MKVPYIKEKRRKEMMELATEFSFSIAGHLEPSELAKNLKSGWLSNLHAVFALLQILLDTPHNLNPSREYALEGSKREIDHSIFVKAVNAFQAPADVLQAMRSAYSSTIFSGFIRELRSDLMMVLLHSLMCNYRGAAIGLRCALEDLYRHLYYMDHQQEYAALRDERASEYEMKISPQGLREYLSRASYLQSYSSVGIDFAPKSKDQKSAAIVMDCFGWNEKLYGALSAAVHGASDKWFSSIEHAASMKKDLEKEKLLEGLGSEFSKLSVAFLIAAHRNLFFSVGDYDRSIVLNLYSEEERKNLRALLNI